MMKVFLFTFLLINLQGCVFIGIKRTDNYVKKISKSFSLYENKEISNLEVSCNNKNFTTDQLKGSILLISYTKTDSLIEVVNNRLLKGNQPSDTIINVIYNGHGISGKEVVNPFQNKKIFNVLVDKNSKIVGTNIRKIESERYQSDYYLDYAIYRIKDGMPISKSYYEYKWGVIHYCKWSFPSGRYSDDIFGNWLKYQIEKKIIALDQNIQN